MFRVLIAEPHRSRLAATRRALRAIASTQGCSTFELAERRLRSAAPELLVTNLRLDPHRGIELVRLAEAPTRSVVYMVPADPFALREAQDLGAFVEFWPRMPSALPSYVGANLPPRDRRDVTVVDRRTLPRGGRRAADAGALGSATLS